ncbi:MAG TPA: AAA family ATPase, partial [Candidatus Janibacter merdipullorum]|nr:AAA family ATPase [Candidatus Janibacter merdipullorum]
MPLAPRTRPLIGRASELERLRRSSGAAAPAPSGAAALVSGDAGIGKSRLVAELAAEAREAGRLVLAGHCVGAGGDALAWLPFVELVGELARSSSTTFDAVLDRHPTLAVLHPSTSPSSTPADAGQVAEGVHALLTAAAEERPLLVVIEDVHWSDHSSRDLLTVLLTRGFNAPVTLVVTYRSDDLHRRHPLHEVLSVWTRLPLVTRVELSPLPSEEMHRLVRDLEDGPTTTGHVSEVVDRAGGNPFFAEEIVAAGDSTATPQDLTRLLRLRLDRLDAPARLLVRAASLAGSTVDPDLLGVVTGLDPDALDDAFQQAIDHQILEVGGQGTFRFRHPLLGETVAGELLPGQRRRLHRAWLTALQDHPDRGPAADLARHAAATGDTATAAEAAVEAGDEALRVGGARDALRLYEAALGWVDGPGRRAEIALAASIAAKAAGDQVRSLDLLEEGIADLPTGEHPRLRADMLARAAGWYSTLDLPGDPLGMSTEAVDLLPEWREPGDFAVLMRHLDVLVQLGRSEESARLIDRVIARAEELGLPGVVAEARLHEARLLSQVDPERARPGLLATAEDPSAPASLRLPALLRLGTLERNEGNTRRAYEYYVQGAEIAEERQRPWGPYGMECRLQAGRAAYEIGRWDDARRLLTSPADLPHPPRGFMEGALVELQVAQGVPVDPGRLDETQQWWEVDALLVVSTLGGLIDLVGRLDRPADLLDLLQRAVRTIDRLWFPHAQAIIRLAALFTGQVADLAARGHDVSALREQSDAYTDRLAEMTTLEDQVIGLESEAWLRRHEAERLRLAAVAGERPTPDALVDAWREATEAFASLSNRPEHARSAARLAEALVLVGRTGEAREAAATARAVAEELGARPVLDLLDGLQDATEDRPDPRGSLTPRELEVLTHLE